MRAMRLFLRISVSLVAALAWASCYRTAPAPGADDGDSDTESETATWPEPDSDADSDSDGDSDGDSDTDSDSDTDADCGFLDDACCPGGDCADEDALCVQTDTDPAGTCFTGCAPDTCADEGLSAVSCHDVSGGNGIGACWSEADLNLDTPMGAGNACEGVATGDYAYNGFCCPLALGGNGLGYGPGYDGDAESGRMCDGVDMSALEAPAEYADLLGPGVGICLSDGDMTDVWCAVPCAYENSCVDPGHSCTPLGYTAAEGGYCLPI